MPKCALLAILLVTTMATGQTAQNDAHQRFAALRDAYLAKFKPLFLESETAWWEANITGADAAYARKTAADQALVDLHSDHAVFAQLKELKEAGGVTDPTLRRELDVVYRSFLAGQADPQLQKQIVALENDVEQIFNTHRSPVGDKILTENEVRDILANSTKSADVEAAWKGYMEVGRKADEKLRRLVQLRNEKARQLGFPDFFTLSLALQEIDQAELFKLFDELDALTREPFAQLKADLDKERAARFGIPVAELRPWHFGDLFFQEAPASTEVDLDGLFKDADLLALSKTYYASIGLPANDILARSDLYEKPGKCPHAFCSDLDRAGDIRVLANLQPNIYWANTILHELGHGVYDKYIHPDVPFLLRTASHGITTEGIAELFGALVKNEEWLQQVLGLDADTVARIGPAVRKSLRTERLMFSRWAQVMLRFEQGMYTKPDQDLGRLWWDLKQRYQLLSPPESVARPDYAAKVHVLTTPVYYHNYMMGELFAAQVRHALAREVGGKLDAQRTSFYDHPQVGAFLRDKVFGPGNLYAWHDLTQRATGEPLTARYFAADLAAK
ncbi:MAG: M2 family metallopeptidase [Phycisphaerae bacterium]|nr:M2 family metallopeptidase [Phycisphaerae bacterium]HQL53354.1 M2 family metallopeptidase [Phycisphaerae bacterium]